MTSKVRSLAISAVATMAMVVALLVASPPGTAQAYGVGDVLKLTVTNASSGANKYVYKKFSGKSYTFASGDYIEYDVLQLTDVVGAGGVDIFNSDGSYF